MNIKLRVRGGGNSFVEIYFTCCNCLEEMEDKTNHLKHPTHKKGFFGDDKKDKPLPCQYSGQSVAHPLVFNACRLA